MIHVLIKGQISKKIHIIDFVGDTLTFLMPRIRRNIDVDIEIVNQIADFPHYYAQCSGDKQCADITLARHDENGVRFTLDEMVLNLSHELVHAKQYFRGELSPSMSRWKGQDHSNTSYARTPWEREAFKLQYKLYNMIWCGREHFIK